MERHDAESINGCLAKYRLKAEKTQNGESHSNKSIIAVDSCTNLSDFWCIVNNIVADEGHEMLVELPGFLHNEN